MEQAYSVSQELERWLERRRQDPRGPDRAVRGEGFALLFVLLLGVPALPLPTGGATHVFEVIAVLLALQLIMGRDKIWLPQRWRGSSSRAGAGSASSPA